jgi:putative membrane protein
MRNRLAVPILAACALSFPAVARSQEGELRRPSELSAADQAFLQHAATENVAEIGLGKLARDKALTPAVKKFAQRLIDDHSTLTKDLATVADRKGLTLPTTMTKKDKALYDKLAGLAGIEFDVLYTREMVAHHVLSIGKYEAVGTDGDNVDVRSFATRTVPQMREHLSAARALADEVKPPPPPRK